MSIIVRSVLSTDWVRIKVSAVVNGVYVDLSQDVVQFAFPVSAVAPVSGDWKTGSWTTTTQVGQYWAQILVGPTGSPVLAVGVYDIWIKVFDTPAVPTELRGQIRIE